jgi:hypothetical protein
VVAGRVAGCGRQATREHNVTTAAAPPQRARDSRRSFGVLS